MGSVERNISEDIVFTRKEDLREFIVLKGFVSIWIKVINQVINIIFSGMLAVIFSEEHSNFFWSNYTITIIIEDLEGSIKRKVRNGAQSLSAGLDIRFTFLNANEKVKESSSVFSTNLISLIVNDWSLNNWCMVNYWSLMDNWSLMDYCWYLMDYCRSLMDYCWCLMDYCWCLMDHCLRVI